jgi:hypothetical protein
VPSFQAVALFGNWPKDDIQNPYRGQWFVAALSGEILAAHLESEGEAHKFIKENFKGGEYSQLFNKQQRELLSSKTTSATKPLKATDPIPEDEPTISTKVHKKPATK